MRSSALGGRGGRLAGGAFAGAAVGGFGARGGFAGGWNGGGGFGGGRGWGGGGWGWGGWGWGGWWGGGLAGLAFGLTFGYPYWDPWDYGGYGYGGGYWGSGYWGADYGSWGPGSWGPGYVGYWDEPYYAGWAPDGYDYGYAWRPRLWRRDRRPIVGVGYDQAQPAIYQPAVAYDVAANCGGAHYVWSDYVGGYVFRPYDFPC
jgi:hypothetical protein